MGEVWTVVRAAGELKVSEEGKADGQGEAITKQQASRQVTTCPSARVH